MSHAKMTHHAPNQGTARIDVPGVIDNRFVVQQQIVPIHGTVGIGDCEIEFGSVYLLAGHVLQHDADIVGILFSGIVIV